MDEEILIKLLNDLKKEAANSYGYIGKENGFRFIGLLKNCISTLKDHESYILKNISEYEQLPSRDVLTTVKRIDYLLLLLKLHQNSKLKEFKILNGAQDKLKEAGVSFGNEDYTSVINNLNTSIELALKDELDIPTTITKINTRRIIDFCIAEDIGPADYLKEVIKHVLEIDNKIKHQGYNPTKVDCINALASVESFFKKIKKYPMNPEKELKEKIFNHL